VCARQRETEEQGTLMGAEYQRPAVNVEWLGQIGGPEPDPDIWRGAACSIPYRFDKLPREFYKSRVGEYFAEVTPGAEIRCVEKRFSGTAGLLYDLVQGIPPSTALLQQVLGSEQGRFSSKALRGESGKHELERLAEAIKAGHVVSEDPLFQIIRAEVETEPLGPQTVGGTQAMAYAYRIAMGVRPGVTLKDDLEEIGSFPDEFSPGNHRDETAKPPKIGCTAMDKDEVILYRATTEVSAAEIQRLASWILGREPDEQLDREVHLGFDALNNPEIKDSYFMRESGVATHREAGLRTMETAHGSEVEIVTGGPEGAVFFLVNRVPGQTLHKNLWALDIMGMGIATPPGVYSLDFSRSLERAQTLFDDEATRRKFLKARARYNATTLLELCDGTLELGEVT